MYSRCRRVTSCKKPSLNLPKISDTSIFWHISSVVQPEIWFAKCLFMWSLSWSWHYRCSVLTNINHKQKILNDKLSFHLTNNLAFKSPYLDLDICFYCLHLFVMFRNDVFNDLHSNPFLMNKIHVSANIKMPCKLLNKQSFSQWFINVWLHTLIQTLRFCIRVGWFM